MRRPRRLWLRLGALALAVAAAGCDGGGPEAGAQFEVVSGEGQRALAGEMLGEAVLLRLRRDGQPVAGVPFAVEVVEGGGSASGSSDRTGYDGSLKVMWRLGSAGPQRLRVTAAGADPVEVRAQALRPDEFDRVVVRGGRPRAVVVTRPSASGLVVLHAQLVEGTEVFLPYFDGGVSEVIVFGHDRAPGWAQVTWTPGGDRVDVALRPPIPLDIRFVIHEPPFEYQRNRALENLASAEAVWASEGAGLVVGDVEVEDRTATDAGMSGLSGNLCGSGGGVEGRIVVHYIADVNNALHSGYSCGPDEIYMDNSAERYPYLLAHEIGHSLSLYHTETGVMNPLPPGRRLYDGQIFQAHVEARSAVNAVFEGLALPEQRSCPGDCLNALFEVE